MTNTEKIKTTFHTTENVRLLLAALAVFDGLCKDVVLLPEMDGLDLALDEIEIRGDFFKHATTPPKNTPRPGLGRGHRGTTQVGAKRPLTARKDAPAL